MLNLYQKMIKGMKRESACYWLGVGVKIGDITEGQAGFLFHNYLKKIVI